MMTLYDGAVTSRAVLDSSRLAVLVSESAFTLDGTVTLDCAARGLSLRPGGQRGADE
jgi:hypothetical protein